MHAWTVVLLALALTSNAARGQTQASVQHEGNHQDDPPHEKPAKKGDPVNLTTGDFEISTTDFNIPGRGMDFSFTRTYRSRSDMTSTLGPNWDFNWNQFISLEFHTVIIGGGDSASQGGGADGGIYDLPLYGVTGAFYYTGEDRIEPFYPDQSLTQWATPPGYFAKLRDDSTAPLYQVPPTDFQLRSADGRIYTFDVIDFNGDPFVFGVLYHLHTIQDRKGNTITLSYDVVGPTGSQWHRLHQITDTYNRTITFDYDPSYGSLLRVTDFNGRYWTFTHDSGVETELKDVITTPVSDPVVPPIGSSYPSGKTVHYEYDTAHGSQHYHDLLKIYDAQEWQDPIPQNQVPYVQNTYDASSRVLTQVFGGTNTTGVPAGGQFTFQYVSYSPPNDYVDAYGSWSETARTITVDPNGNVEAHLYDVNGADRLTYQFTGRVSSSPQGAIGLTINPNQLSTGDHLTSPLVGTLRGSSVDPGCYWTRREYNNDGLVTDERTPLTHFLYTYDASFDPFQKGNLVKVEQRPMPADTTPGIITTYAYEPLYCQLRATIDPRGNDLTYVPQNGDATSGVRYMTVNYFDYQEGASTASSITTLVNTWSIDLAASQGGIPAGTLPPMSYQAAWGLNDINGDNLTNQTAGNIIKHQAPIPHVLADPVNSGTNFTTLYQDVVSKTQFNSYSLPIVFDDPVGNRTQYSYNAGADPTDGSTSGPGGGGFLNHRDAPESVTESFAYDQFGRVVQHTDGRGKVTNSVYNELDQLVQETNARGYLHQYIYDWNNDVIEERMSNKVPQFDTMLWVPTGSETDGASGGMIREYYQYDILDHKITDDIQASTGTNGRLVTKYRYDAKGNRVLTLLPESMSPQGQLTSANVISSVYDERDLIWQSTSGGISTDFYGLAANAGIPELNDLHTLTDATLASTSRVDYDFAGQVIRQTDGMNHAVSTAYDAYERLYQTTDPLGNYTLMTLDVAGEAVQVDNHEHQNGSADTVLSTLWKKYDELGRVFQTDQALTSPTGLSIPEGPLSPGDHKATTRFVFNQNSLPIEVVNDNQHYSTMTYDGLNRLRTTEDSVKVQGTADNITTYTYDKNDNLIETNEAEVNPDGTSTLYVARAFYDELDRMTASIESTLNNSGVNLTTRYAYDSLGRRVFESDPLASGQTVAMSSLDPWHEHPPLSGYVNDHGNTAISTFDDAGHLLTSVRHMRVNGTGGNGLAGSQCGDGLITIARTYDRDGRVIYQTDDNLNATHTDYDVLNRTAHVYQPNSTIQVLTYNKDSLVATLTDSNYSQQTNNYDNDDRLLSRSISYTSTPSGATTSETYGYDGLGRVTSAANKAGLSTIANVVRGYDSLARVVSETINGKTTTSLYDGVGNLVDCTYPGVRHIKKSYDRRERLQYVNEGLSTVAQYQYLGKCRVYTRDYLNGTRLTASYDEVRRVNGTDHTQISSGAHIDQRSYAWDRASNKTNRTNQQSLLSHTYTYDSQYRMVQSTRSQPAPLTVTYALDGVHNRSTVTGGSSAGPYTMSAGDLQVNQYTNTPWDNRTYDNNGNVTQFLHNISGTKSASIIYNYRNEMIQYNDLVTLYSHNYVYDAFGRRISKTVRDAAGSHVTNLYYIGWQVVEEQDAIGTTLATYVYGNGIDEVLSMRRGGVNYYYHSDDLGNVMKLTNSSVPPTVQETNDYGDYGELLDGTNLAPKTGSTIGNPYFFTGSRLDSETGLYYMRARYMEPRTGRFITRDPIGIWGDQANLGNGSTYVGNNPWTWTDPTGLHKRKHKAVPSYREQTVAREARKAERLLAWERGTMRADVRGDTSYTDFNGDRRGSNPFDTRIDYDKGFHVQTGTWLPSTSPSATEAQTSDPSGGPGTNVDTSEHEHNANGHPTNHSDTSGDDDPFDFTNPLNVERNLARLRTLADSQTAEQRYRWAVYFNNRAHREERERRRKATNEFIRKMSYGYAIGQIGVEGGAEGGALKYHYTTAPESSFADGLWSHTSVTDKLYTSAAEASDELGIPTPDKVIPIRDTGEFVPNSPPEVEPSGRYSGGGKDFFNPKPCPATNILPARPIR